ncbi:hypothetical protein [Alcanivorax quisquiliarum]|uniref:Tellurite resistance protein TerB n=1 Tax=Alcanivorax quisquiliarum TaxID=2933565 RepID=A0ABT0E9Z4_9GAMM|nr:hypothetical protein [Alcanivorax quisquiliarum]MCK0538657.1 hypothetical protein [Alcanivorax quisquiliarum]
MFLQNLDPQQQNALLYLAKKVMLANGEVSLKEKALYDRLESQCIEGAKPSEPPSLAQVFPDRRSKVSLIIELMGMALADETYHEEESHIIENVADDLLLEDQLLDDIETWVRKQFILIEEATTFMEQ